jgi:hypothetical protein
MAMPRAGRWRRWILPGSGLLLGLLALAWLVPHLRLVSLMRGDAPAGDEVKGVEGFGY